MTILLFHCFLVSFLLTLLIVSAILILTTKGTLVNVKFSNVAFRFKNKISKRRLGRSPAMDVDLKTKRNINIIGGCMKDRIRQRQNRKLKEERLNITNEYGVKDITPYCAVLRMNTPKHGAFYAQKREETKKNV